MPAKPWHKRRARFRTAAPASPQIIIKAAQPSRRNVANEAGTHGPPLGDASNWIKVMSESSPGTRLSAALQAVGQRTIPHTIFSRTQRRWKSHGRPGCVCKFLILKRVSSLTWKHEKQSGSSCMIDLNFFEQKNIYKFFDFVIKPISNRFTFRP